MEQGRSLPHRRTKRNSLHPKYSGSRLARAMAGFWRLMYTTNKPVIKRAPLEFKAA